MLYKGLADRKSKPCTLGKVIQLHEAAEYVFLFVIGNTATGIGNIEIECLAALFVAKADAARVSEFDGISYQIDDDLRNTVTFGLNMTIGQAGLEDKFHIFFR